MDNPNWPIMVVNLRTGLWEKVLDSQLQEVIDRLGEVKTFRVDKDAKLIKSKGKLVIRGISFPLVITPN
jgi:hypothetical protein